MEIQRKKIESSVKSHNHVRVLHLIEIYCYRGYRFFDECCGHITALSKIIRVLKGSNRRPDAPSIHEWMMEGAKGKFSEEDVRNKIIRLFNTDFPNDVFLEK